MGVGEYLIIFAAILIGLAVADLAMSLHRLLRQGRNIRWHPIAPVAGFLVLCLILNLWWGLYYDLADLTQIEFIRFLPTVFMLLSLFLMAAAVFPDKELEAGASLRDHYLDHRGQFWGLFAAYLALVNTVTFMKGVEADWELSRFAAAMVPNLIWIVLCVALMMTKRMWAHWGVLGASLLVVVLTWSSLELTQAAAG